jgi:hypothetical protein
MPLTLRASELVTLEFEGEIWFWKGPAPHFFVTVSAKGCEELRSVQSFVSYGWGMIPVTVRIGGSEWTTSLFPKDGAFIVPLKALIRKAEGLEEGDTVTVRLEVSVVSI